MASFGVVSSRRSERLLPDGRTKPVYVVWIETVKGATGSAEIDASVWDSDGLLEELQSIADNLDRAFDVVASLG